MFLDLGIVLVVFRSDSRVVDDFLPSCYAMTIHGGIESIYCCIVCVVCVCVLCWYLTSVLEDGRSERPFGGHLI